RGRPRDPDRARRRLHEEGAGHAGGRVHGRGSGDGGATGGPLRSHRPRRHRRRRRPDHHPMAGRPQGARERLMSRPEAGGEPPRSAHAESAEAVLESLGSTPDGLSRAEARARLERYGPNRLQAARATPAWKIFVAQLRSVVVLLLVVAAVVAFLLGDPLEAAAIGVVLLINTLLGFFTELRARRAMEALLELEAPHATVVREGTALEIEAHEVVPGDVILLEAGQAVPADARLIETHELRTSEAPLTGES